MRKFCLFIVFFACLQAFSLPHYELGYRLGGSAAMMMPDGKVDQWINRPTLGGQFAVEFLPTGRWKSLKQWNNASIGVGAGYLNLGNDAYLGSAFTAFAYMNQPFYNGTHFRIGARPTLGLAAVNKTYRNTLPDDVAPYTKARDAEGKLIANWSIGSILNAYMAMELYMDFPIKDGWAITLSGGWHHISNGSFMHPNSGYNLFGGELGVSYRPNDTPTKNEPKSPQELHEEVDKPWAVEVSITGGAKQNYYADNQHGQQFFGVASMKAAAYWIPVAVFRLGAGLDAFYDGYYAAVNDEFAAQNPEGTPVTYFGKTYLKTSDVKNCFRLGFSIQPEFIIGHLTAGIHVGFYLYDPVKNLEPYDAVKNNGGEPLHRGLFYAYDFSKASNYQDGWCYMQFVLKYHIMEHLFVQLGLKTHGVRAEFIDAGLGIDF